MNNYKITKNPHRSQIKQHHLLILTQLQTCPISFQIWVLKIFSDTKNHKFKIGPLVTHIPDDNAYTLEILSTSGKTKGQYEPSHSVVGQVNLVQNMFYWLQWKFRKHPPFATRKFWSSLDPTEHSESGPFHVTRLSKQAVILHQPKMGFSAWLILSITFLHSKSAQSTMPGKLLMTKTHLNGPIIHRPFFLMI